MNMKLRIALTLLALGSLVGGCAEQRGPLPGDSVAADGAVTLSPPRLSTAPQEVREAREGLGPIESRLFPPELVMEHQLALALTEEQRRALIQETERSQADMVRLQWDLQAEKEKLVKLLDGDKADEEKVREAAARVMDRESKVKASHLAMLVHVKNLLTSEQLTKLRELRAGAVAKPPSQPAPMAQRDAGPDMPTHSGMPPTSPPSVVAPRTPRPKGPTPVPKGPVQPEIF